MFMQEIWQSAREPGELMVLRQSRRAVVSTDEAEEMMSWFRGNGYEGDMAWDPGLNHLARDSSWRLTYLGQHLWSVEIADPDLLTLWQLRYA